MKNQSISVKTTGKGFYILDEYINNFLQEVNAKDGLLNIFIKHTSASLLITENYDLSVKEDLLDFFEKIAPNENDFYRHNLEGPDDMPAHIKNAVLPQSISIPICNKKMQLGTWQSVYLVEHKDSTQIRKIVLSFLY